MDSTQQLRSLKRGLRALVLLNETGLLTVSELSRRIRVPRTTAHRILDTLVAEEYAEKVPNGRGYQLTPLVRRLSHGYDDESWITTIAQPIIERLSVEIKWPLSLTTPRGDRMLVRVCTDHSSPLALTRVMPGYNPPMMRTTAGHVYLAFCSLEQRELTLAVIRRSSDPLQVAAHDATRLNAVLTQIKKNGYMILEPTEYPEGNIGVPVLSLGRPVAALVMRYIKSTLTPDDVVRLYLERLQTTADLIAKGIERVSTQEPAVAMKPRPWADGQLYEMRHSL